MSFLHHHEKKNGIPRFVGIQYRTINIKTVSEEAMETLLKACSEKPGARMAWVEHPAEDETPRHFHFCASFTSPVRLSEALQKLYESDPHNYCKPCRNFRASVRYLAHLDNPEKVQIDPSKISLAGDWDGANLRSWFERKGATADLSRVLHALRSFLDEHDNRFSRVDFALWLDSHGYNSHKAFKMLRDMNLMFEDLVDSLSRHPEFSGDAHSCDVPTPHSGE